MYWRQVFLTANPGLAERGGRLGGRRRGEGVRGVREDMFPTTFRVMKKTSPESYFDVN